MGASLLALAKSIYYLNYLFLSISVAKGQGPIPKTQHVHDQQMFLLLTNHKSKFLQRAKKY